ncbi:MAG: tRNA (adenosine(37)-N6)-threonylcarbamoyltransferase complex transferase subunit TsaD [Pirellulaceae bacterium]
MTRILTIESTCDETAAAILDESLQVLGACIATQNDLHARFQGVVPEIAARAHLERILPVLQATFDESQLSPLDIDAIAVASQPGLANSLLVGLTVAKTLALVLNKPLIDINHLHAHVYACQIAFQKPIFPCLGLIVSGGHTHMFTYPNALEPELIGGTIDDAAGEAFDKVANMLRLGFPGGPALAKLAEEGDPEKYSFPRSFLRDEKIAFSFSGLKTAVRYELAGYGAVDFETLEIPKQKAADIAASFQAAVVDVLCAKSRQAIRVAGMKRLCIGGGVAANQALRKSLMHMANEEGIELLIAPPELCTDNAVMGAIAFEKFKRGMFADQSLDIIPGLIR